jgi:sirohydrochlorin cobaltochelatase
MAGAVILFAHGARDPEWRAPVDRLVALVARRLPAIDVRAAFLEHMRPALDEAVAGAVGSGAARVLIVPVFLARGGHLKNDLPRLVAALREAHPGAELSVVQPVGEAAPVLEAMADWIAGAEAAS